VSSGIRVIAVVGAVVCLAALAGCSSSGSGYHEDTYPVSKGHDKHTVVIGRGKLAANRWSLLADVDGDGQLCLGIRWMPATGPVDTGCGFGNNQIDDEGRGTEPVASSQAADGSVLVFGPAPAGAVRATLSSPAVAGTDCRRDTVPTTVVPITHRLPGWYPVRGGWFTAQVPAAALECRVDVVFHDRSDKVVPQPTNF
jgi:hypothetical protein